MARLYNGFNALALGQAINNTNNDIHNRRMTGLQMLGDGVKDFIKEREEEQRKQSAIDFLVGNGMTQENASSLANSGIEPGQLALYMQGRLDKTADTTDERKYAEGLRKEGNDREDFIYGRNRADTLQDRADERAYQEDLEGKIFDRNRAASIENQEYDALNGRYQTLLAKVQASTVPNQADIDELNLAKQQLDEWLEKHPNYTPIEFGTSGVKGQGAKWTDRSTPESMKALIESDGKVDPKKFNEFEETYLNDTGRSLQKDFPDYYKYIAQKQRGRKTKRNAENPNSGNITTEEDYEKIFKDEKENQRLNGLLASVKTALVNGGGYPELSERDIALLTKKDKATMGLYNRIMSRNKWR